MNRRPGLMVSAVAFTEMLGISAWAWTQIPEGARIATHFDLSGRANGYSSKPVALFLLPAIALGIGALMYFLPNLEPRQLNLRRSAGAYNAVWAVTVAVLAAVHSGVVLNATGHWVFDIFVIVSMGVGFLFVVLGAYLGRIQSNFFIGIRTPWTLSSDVSWQKTHQLAGRLFAMLGVVMLFSAWIRVLALVFLGGLILVALVTVVYSYLVWRGDPDRETLGRA